MAKFKPGQSGNPKGRKPGSRNAVSVLCSDLLGADAAAIMGVCIVKAKEGDPVALRLCVDRLVSARAARDRSVVVESLPDMSSARELVTAAAAVIGAAAAGTMSLSEAKDFLALISAQRALIETQDLAVRLEVLERAQADGGAEPAAVLDLARRVHRSIDQEEGRG